MLDLRLRFLKERLLEPFATYIPFSPISLTLTGLVFGLISAFLCASGIYGKGFVFWWLNRIFDGLDGVVARVQKKQSDLGGYLDILCDFLVYALLPVCLVVSRSSDRTWLLVALLESAYFVNAASLFQLAAILEKRALGSKSKKELTTITMPDAGGKVLIEGTETMVFYSLFILFPEHLDLLFLIFASLVAITSLQRLALAVWYF
eukprot:TRINITY_DN28313_c0_g1_i1.p1 TRINITY_DN28313_c0_g1~~TRINITY_DN28313_c0_g1_i1.p1  ORF type:complete len:205 (-),score=25.54 TRINITY_DN28313_c0_g1_i1:13-627(-)